MVILRLARQKMELENQLQTPVILCQEVLETVFIKHLYLHFLLNKSIWLRNGILTSITTIGQSGPGSNGNKQVLYTPQISRTGASPEDAV